ncbi:MAG: hypothetical protein EA344_10385 [Alkalicoccus sp.]|uniref:Uncharacterized protein n=1 Tax=Alkalicoccus sp. TaxID=2005376 RepID=A0A651DTZ2_9BACI|nr:MAG: hypothetical protein EA344_10385 [Alkalicoccus sp.]
MENQTGNYEELLTSFFMYQTLYLQDSASLSSYYQSLQKELEDQSEQQEKLEKAYKKVCQNLTGKFSAETAEK